MNGYQRDRLDDRSLQTNQKLVEEFVDDQYNDWKLGPHSWAVLLNGAQRVRIGAGSHCALELPNALVPAAFFERSRPTFWVKGNLRVSLSYTGDVSSTNGIRLGGTIDVLNMGGLTTDAGVSYAVTIPGPAVANTELFYTGSIYIPVDQRCRMIGVTTLRDSGHADDTYAGNFRILELIVKYLPGGQAM